MRLNLNLLRIFHAVATEGNFSQAARALHISQPAVSKAVAELERQLDLALVERTGGRAARGLSLTDAGSALNEHARAIFSLEQAAMHDLGQRRGLHHGELVIGASTTIANYWLPAYLKAFATGWPDISLKVVVANTQSIAQDLFDCLLDIALVEGPVHMNGLAYHPWKEERLIIAAPPSFARDSSVFTADRHRKRSGTMSAIDVSVADLGRYTWLTREAGSGTREVAAELLSRHGVTPRRYIEIGSNAGIARAVAAGLGVAMLPFAVVEDLLHLGKLTRLRVQGLPELSRPLYRLERLDRPASPAMRVFLDVLITSDQ